MVVGEEFSRRKYGVLTRFNEFEYERNQTSISKNNYLFLAKLIIPTAIILGGLTYSIYNLNSSENNNI